MATEGGGGDLVLPHVAGHVVGDALGGEVRMSVGVSEVTGVQNVDVAVLQELTLGLCEEGYPVLGNIKDFGDEDEVGEVVVASLDLDSSESDIIGVGHVLGILKLVDVIVYLLRCT